MTFDDVPSGAEAVVKLGLAVWSTAPFSKPAEVSLAMSCEGAADDAVELVRDQIVTGPGPEWNDHHASLDACSRPFTTLELRSECVDGPCDGVVVAWGAPRVEVPREGRSRAQRLVLLVSVDTLRPDRMELYGGPAATPALQRLARDGVVFESVVAPSPWTVPSHASMFTSTYPHVHGATGKQEISRDVATVAEVLQRAGWETAGFVDTPWLGRLGFSRGHDHYDASRPPRPVSRWGVAVTAPRLLRWLTTVRHQQVYLFWHIMDVHGPYGSTAPFAGRRRVSVDTRTSAYPDISVLGTLGYHKYLDFGRFTTVEEAIAAYDEGITMVDAAIGRVLDVLRASGL